MYDKEIKSNLEKVLEGFTGIINMSKEVIDKNIEELKKVNPEEGEKQARAYAQALGGGAVNINSIFGDIHKQVESIKKNLKDIE